MKARVHLEEEDLIVRPAVLIRSFKGEMSVMSFQKLFIFITFKNLFWIKVSKN